MESIREYRQLFQKLSLDRNPFTQGTNLCCTAHTNLNRYKQSLRAIESYEMGRNIDTDIVKQLDVMQRSYQTILVIGYCLAKNHAPVFTLEMEG